MNLRGGALTVPVIRVAPRGGAVLVLGFLLVLGLGDLGGLLGLVNGLGGVGVLLLVGWGLGGLLGAPRGGLVGRGRGWRLL